MHDGPFGSLLILRLAARPGQARGALATRGGAMQLRSGGQATAYGRCGWPEPGPMPYAVARRNISRANRLTGETGAMAAAGAAGSG